MSALILQEETPLILLQNLIGGRNTVVFEATHQNSMSHMNFKIITPPIAGILAGAITLLNGTVHAQEVPLLKQKMPYSEAREILINAGWQAIEIPILQRGERFFGAMEYIIKDLGYNEVADCSGTGLGLCRFEFAAADGQKLIVVTAANDRRAKQPVILYRWWVEKE
ncbi:hypothetical protein H6F89_29670 [Cyanobacteria bacterium FACHB-63]|nr:hypothetical protein [Cyanobacteria bacterium FACHB-63]